MRRPFRVSLIALTAALTAGLCGLPAADAAPARHRTPTLADPRPCPGLTGVTCAYLEVPLDRGGSVPDRLRLKVAMADNVDAPRGVLVVLSGGPGQPGVPFFQPLRESLRGALTDYRLVMIDQRGTGETAVSCPQVQREVGSSDIRAASPEAVRACADSLGERRNFYTSAETVADLDDLRVALGARSWTLDGVSYGTFVAQRYALTHPHRLRRLVLDSVVRQDNADPLYVAALSASGTVLRVACREQACPSDPARDLAEALRRTGRPVELLDMLIIFSIIDPKLTDPTFSVLDRLRAAGAGDPGPITELLGWFSAPDDSPMELFSAGLHLATLCADVRDMPWGDSSAPLEVRDRAVQRAVARLPGSATWPFPKQTAGQQGIVANCRHWPPSRPIPPTPFHRLTMPALLLAGDRDLSTPVRWAQEQESRMSNAKLVVIPGAGHSVQRRSTGGAQEAVRFLLS
ncbi:alpha/beta hydrolase [Actinophytocola sp.]|uniref:alpha/beta fold hydrolase n=1 Tax=Actinophytocola sp. TaxID=1872138 RepID=UPI002D80D92D|nr:alpha/beta hydrolase [Actinophytocola sp.]HET9141155.1 alpha/beta hydrolase [Actinophytocola sp.]